MDDISRIFPNTAADLDEDLGNVRMLLDSQQKSQEAELLKYFEKYENPEDGTSVAPSTYLEREEISENFNYCRNSKLENAQINKIFNAPDKMKSRNRISNPGSDKWGPEKEKFLDNSNIPEISDRKEPKFGTVKIKESFIEPPRMGRISKSFHGKLPPRDIHLDINTTPRRASDNMVNLSRPVFRTQMSQPSTSVSVGNKEEIRKTSLTENYGSKRFTTVLVNENQEVCDKNIDV